MASATSIEFNYNPQKSATLVIQLGEYEAIHRNRFGATSVQTTGNVYVSNHLVPAKSISDASWVPVTSKDGKMYIIDYPVNWVVASASAYVCSYVDGNF